MWEPDPSWHRCPVRVVRRPSGSGSPRSTARRWVVKRLAAPEDQPHLLDPGHAGYWRREAEVAAAPQPSSTGPVWCRP